MHWRITERSCAALLRKASSKASSGPRTLPEAIRLSWSRRPFVEVCGRLLMFLLPKRESARPTVHGLPYYAKFDPQKPNEREKKNKIFPNYLHVEACMQGAVAQMKLAQADFLSKLSCGAA
jgi:hypothetical protein